MISHLQMLALVVLGLAAMPVVAADEPAQTAAPAGQSPPWFAKADKNGDGQLSREEFWNPDNFSKVDADGGGFATLKELQAWFAKNPRPAAGQRPAGKVTATRPVAAEPTDAAPTPDDIEQRPVTIWSHGVKMAGDIYLPKSRKPGEKLPAIVFCAGSGGTKKGLPTRLGPILAKNGFICLGFDYRGWGESDAELLVTEKVSGPDADGDVTVKGKPIRWQMNLMDQTFDIRAAISFLQGEAEVDANRIGLFGSSYGGGLVTLMAAIDPRVKCAASQVSGLGIGPQADKAGFALLTQQARGEIEPDPLDTGKLGGKMERYVNMRRNPARNVGFGEKLEVVGRIRVPMIFVDAEKEELSDPKENGEKFAAILKENGVQVLCGAATPAVSSGSGRLELADWIASPENPLTARVFVNRVWLNLFGRGLVSTPDNFGVSGQTPSHPDLLDHLALTFVEDNWSVKRLIRRIVLSRVYRLDATFVDANFEKDPENVWLWRMSPRRLDAEAVRDAMLATAGKLDLKSPVGSAVANGGGLVGHPQTPNETGHSRSSADIETRPRTMVARRAAPKSRRSFLRSVSYGFGSVAFAAMTVFAMTSTSCPLSKKYLPTLVELVTSSGPDATWVLVNPLATDKLADMQTAAGQFHERAIYVHDKEGHLAATLGALTTTDVIVLDAARTVTYHGAIDDQYGFGYSIDAPRYRYLADALAAITTGKQPLVSATEAPGCTLEQPSQGVRDADLTYHNRISRIMQRHCVACHREGGVGPFALDTYDDIVAHAGMVKQVVERGIMPPWFAVESKPDAESNAVHTPWANDRSLADAEKKDLLAWFAGGKPEGDRRDAPQPLKFDEGWLIGKPDAIFQFAKPVPIKASGVMPYQNIVVETNLSDDKWVQAIEVQPGDRGVVHHVLVFVQGEEDQDSELVDDAAAERGGFWGIYVPGNSTLVYPEGFAKRIPRGAKLKFQMHYTPNGAVTTDQTRIGLIWAKEPPKHEVRVAGIVNARISIPPGADNHREEATLRLPMDATLMGFLPHLHLRGKACKYEVTRSDGQTTTLLDIPRYDFNWQLLYRYFEPLCLKAGDVLRFTAWFDNSDKNPANPDPTKTVRWGAQTFDEMHLGYVEYYIPNAKPGESTSLYGGRRRAVGGIRTGFDLEAIFQRLDRNSDGESLPLDHHCDEASLVVFRQCPRRSLDRSLNRWGHSSSRRRAPPPPLIRREK